MDETPLASAGGQDRRADGPSQPNKQTPERPWSWYWALGWFVTFLACYLLLGAALTSIGFLLLEDQLNRGSDVGSATPAGTPLALGLLLSSVTITPVIAVRTSSRTPSYLEVLGLRSVGRTTLAIASALGAITYTAVDLLPGFGADSSAGAFLSAFLLQDLQPTLLLLSALLIAPAFEELLFRGFLIGTLLQSGVPRGLVVAVSVLAWCIAHPQDALVEYGAVLTLACLLAGIRLQSGSIAPCMLVHVLWNTTVLTQALWLS